MLCTLLCRRQKPGEQTAYTCEAPWDIGRPHKAFLDVADRIAEKTCTDDRLRNESDRTASCGLAGCKNALRWQLQMAIDLCTHHDRDMADFLGLIQIEPFNTAD
jgi:hypothetical protein